MPPHNATSWRELVRRLAPDLEFGEPAAPDAIATVESGLGLRLPPEIAEFLLEADGLTDRFGFAVVFTAAEIARRNAEFRSFKDFREIYMPFSHLLLVGEDAGGDLFAYAVDADGSIRRNDLFRWEHETDGRPWYASHLVQYLESRLDDED